MRRQIIPLAIALLGIVGVVAMWIVFSRTEAPHYAASSRIAHSVSDLRLALQIDYDSGPLTEERWTMRNDNGISTSQYRAIGRGGTTITIDSTPRETYDVTFFFEHAVADGVWQIVDKPPRGNTTAHYTIDVYQLVDGQHGSRHITFTDPHYWATTGGHQFKIHLDRNKPVPDLLTLQATSIQDSRYDKLVADFRAFGTDSFKAKIAQAQVRLHRGT